MLTNAPGVTVQQTEHCIKMFIPQTLADWRSGALKLANFINFGAGTIVWVDVTSWGEGWWGEGFTFWNGPRVAELVLSNEIYNPMSSHRRVAVHWEQWIGENWEVATRVWATVQVGNDIQQVGQTIYGCSGSCVCNYGNSLESGYPIYFGIRRDYNEAWKQEQLIFYFYNTRDSQLWTVATYPYFSFESFFGNDHPYIIFGNYNLDHSWYGVTKFDNFQVFDD